MGMFLSGHEYAEDNLLFAAEVEPRNSVRENKYQWVLLQRGQKLCTVRTRPCSAPHSLRLATCRREPAYAARWEFLNVPLLLINFHFGVCIRAFLSLYENYPWKENDLNQ